MSTPLPKLRPYTGWIDIPLFPTQQLRTSISIEKELWVLLRSYSEVKSRGLELANAFGTPAGKANHTWKRFRSFVRQAENYWQAGSQTSYKSSSLLFYYAFLNLVKAYLTLEDPTIPDRLYHGLSSEIGGPSARFDSKCVKTVCRGSAVFPKYFHRVFQVLPPARFNIKSLLAYASDIAFQYTSAGFGERRLFPFIHRIVVDVNRKKSWSIIAVPHVVELGKYAQVLKGFFKEYEHAENPTYDTHFISAFGLDSSAGQHHHFYQSQAACEVPFLGETISATISCDRVMKALGNSISPNFCQDKASAYLNLPMTKRRLLPMNEEIAIYATMFFMSEIVRYRPDYLDAVLETKASWLLQSFVESCPLKFLRAITSRIMRTVIVLSSF